MSRSLGAVILVGIFAVFAGAVYFFEIRPSSEQATGTPTPSPRDVFNLSGQEFNRLAISGDGKQLVAEKNGSAWQILEPKPGLADSTQVTSAFFSLDSLRAFRLVADADPDLTKYGLDQPALKVEFRTSGGQVYGVSFGAENVDKSYRYVKRQDTPAIYLVSADTFKRFQDLLSAPPYQPTPTPSPGASRSPGASPATSSAPPPSPAAPAQGSPSPAAG